MLEFSDTYVDEEGTAKIFVFSSYQAKADFETNLAFEILNFGMTHAVTTNKSAVYILSATKTRSGQYTSSIVVVATGEALWTCTWSRNSFKGKEYTHALADAAKKLLSFNKDAVNKLLLRLADLPAIPSAESVC